jgi:hypothetical protein
MWDMYYLGLDRSGVVLDTLDLSFSSAIMASRSSVTSNSKLVLLEFKISSSSGISASVGSTKLLLNC